MNHQDAHERCPELLHPFVDGSLAEPDASWVREHLAACPACRDEMSALQALLELAGGAPTEPESTRLRREVIAALHEPGAARVVTVPEMSPWKRRLTPALGAAALVAVIAVGVAQLGGQEGGDGGSASRPDARSEASAPGERDETEGRAGGTGEGTETAAQAVPEPAASGSTKDTALRNARSARPIFDAAMGVVTDRSLEKVGRGGRTFVALARTYDTRDAARLRAAFLNRLARLAPDRARPQVRTCARRVFGWFPHYDYLPAYGALGELKGSRSLILGFALGGGGDRKLSRFQLWVWPRGACNRTLLYQSGRIRR